MAFKLKRAYERPEKSDGYRVLVDRLWPRGLTKQKARLDLWLKQIAPSDALRKWFSHDPARWSEFQKRYAKELKNPEGKALLAQLRSIGRQKKTVTLVFSAKDAEHNNAVALKAML